MWLRLLDLPAALSARRYAVADRVVLEVIDDDIGGFATGRYVLDAGPDGATCTPSSAEPADLLVHQRALAAAYLGGFSLRSQAIAGRIDEQKPGALRRADAMFATPMAPWCATGF
jgi:predicted acetyltransferase